MIGDVKDPGKQQALSLAARLWEDIEPDTALRKIDFIEGDLPAHNKVS